MKRHANVSRLRIGVAILVLGTAGPVFAQTEYDFLLVDSFPVGHDLPEAYLWDVNDQGMACGTSTYGSSYTAFCWTERDGNVPILTMIWARGINNAGLVVGDNRTYDTQTGQTVVVPPVGIYPFTRLLDVNDHGVVVGYAECDCSNSDQVAQTALVWDTVNGSRSTGITAARDLVRINNSNVAVGNIRPWSGSSEAYRVDLDTGDWTRLSEFLPAPPYGQPWSVAADINEAGYVAGEGYNGTIVAGAVWSPTGEVTFLPGLEPQWAGYVHPTGINDDNVVVGQALTGVGWRAFVWDETNGVRDLNALVDTGSFVLDRAVEINNEGWIIGIGHWGPGWGTSRSFVLTPVRSQTVAAPAAAPVDGFGIRVVPNPAVDRVQVSWTQPATGHARVAAYDAAGRHVALLFDGIAPAGSRQVPWTTPAGLGAGVYFVRVESASAASARRLVLIR